MINQIDSLPVMQAIAQICEQYHVTILYLFGSQATAVYQSVTTGQPLSLAAGHDIDMGIKCQPLHHLTTMQKVMLAQALEDLFETPRVDLVCLEEADPFLAANIIRGERLYTSDPHAADEYELYILRRAGDLAPFERIRLHHILEGSPP
jgi:predicted nucleotidyltransferase